MLVCFCGVSCAESCMRSAGRVVPELEGRRSAVAMDEEQYEPYGKRTKVSAPSPIQQWDMALKAMSTLELDRDVLSKLRPLGLRLRKSSSLEDLINVKLNQENAVLDLDIMNNHDQWKLQRKSASSTRASSVEKNKATNCHATALRIGAWEYHSMYEGDLLAKFYYATHKLVWEILDDGLKSKMEIQWSDIASLKVTCPEDGPDTLELLLLKVPTFFREVNPQPKKHTLWQVCSDFTGGHASSYRRHFLQCKSGLLAKHFEKLIQCDSYLNSISQQSDILSGNISYEPSFLNFCEHHELNCHACDDLKNAYGYPDEEFQESPLSCASVPTSIQSDFNRRLLVSPNGHFLGPGIEDIQSKENFANGTEVQYNQESNGIRAAPLPPLMSMDNFLLESEQQDSEMNICNISFFDAAPACQDMILQEVAQQLLSDSQISKFDERSVMSKVNSFCSLIHLEDCNDFNSSHRQWPHCN